MDAVDRRVPDVAEEAGAASVGIAGGRVVEREAGDLVAAAVERAGERLRGGAERRPGRAGEVDVRAETVVAGGVGGNRLKLRAGRDERAERGRDGAVVVREDGRGAGGGVGVGRAARPAEEDAARRVDGDRGLRAGRAGAEAGDGGGVAGEEEAAVHEAPREVGLRLAVDLRPAAGRPERGEVARRAHSGRVEHRDARHRGRWRLREAVRDDRRGGDVAREAARVRRAGRRAGRVAAPDGAAGGLRVAGEGADLLVARGVRDRVAVGDGGVVLADVAREAADVAGGGRDRADGEALADAGGALDASREDAGIVAGGRDAAADDGAAVHGCAGVHAAGEGAGVIAARDDGIQEREAGDLAGDVGEEARVVGGAGHGEVGDHVAAPVELAGERGNRRPVRAAEVDVGGEAVGAGGVVRDGGELGARGDRGAREVVHDAEVVEEDGRGGRGGVGVGCAAGPADEEAALRVRGDRGLCAGRVGTEAVYGGGVAGEEELAVHERPREVGLREAVGLRPLAGRVERGEAGAAVHRGGGKRVDADEVGGADVCQAIGDAEAVREGRATAILAAREAADFGGAVKVGLPRYWRPAKPPTSEEPTVVPAA